MTMSDEVVTLPIARYLRRTFSATFGGIKVLPGWWYGGLPPSLGPVDEIFDGGLTA